MIAAHFREFVVFRQESIARMDGIHSSGCGCSEDVGNVQIAAVAGTLPNADRFISQLHMQRIAINGAVDGNRCDSHLPAAPQNSESDFAAVGDQHLADGHPADSRPGRIVSVSGRWS